MNEAVENTRPGGRLQLLALWMIPIGLMAAAIIVYKLVMGGQLSLGSKNEGVLLQPPVQLAELPLSNEAGDSVSEVFAGKWTMVVRGGASCVDACREALYLSRQVHIRLDKEANRVQRIYLSHDAALGEELQHHIGDEHRYLRVVHAEKDVLAEVDEAVAAVAPAARFFLVDPQGWAMMVYEAEHEGGQILKDMKHLLKYSRN